MKHLDWKDLQVSTLSSVFPIRNVEFFLVLLLLKKLFAIFITFLLSVKIKMY